MKSWQNRLSKSDSSAYCLLFTFVCSPTIPALSSVVNPSRTVQLAYGRGFLDVGLPAQRTDVIEPVSVPGLKDEKESFLQSLDHPIDRHRLREHLFPDAKVCIVFTDITRATPNERIIPWLLEYVTAIVPPGNITLINGTGTHRPNTDAELRSLLTDEVVDRYQVLNHDAQDPKELVQVGTTRAGGPALISRRVVEADVRMPDSAGDQRGSCRV